MLDANLMAILIQVTCRINPALHAAAVLGEEEKKGKAKRGRGGLLAEAAVVGLGIRCTTYVFSKNTFQCSF